jgi:hypothetical protein
MSVTQSFIGKDGFTWWVGQVEKNDGDPAGLGRVKVRIAGWYTGENYKENIPTDRLPWAHVMQPTTEYGVKNIGKSNNRLGEGAIVMGFFLDGEEAQQPCVMGILRSFVNTGTDDIDKLKSGEWIADLKASGAKVAGTVVSESTHNTPLGMIAASGERGANKNSQLAAKNAAMNTNPGRDDAGGPGQDHGPAGTSGTQLPASRANPSGIPNACARPVADGKTSSLENFGQTLKYMLCDLGHTMAGLVQNNQGKFISVVTGKVVSVQTIIVKIKRFISYAINGLFAELKAAFANLIGDAVTNILNSFQALPFVFQLLIDTAIQVVNKFMCDFELEMGFGGLINQLAGMVEGLFDELVSTIAAPITTFVSKSFATVENIMAQTNVSVERAINIASSIANAVQVAKSASEAAKKVGSVSEFFESQNNRNLVSNLLEFVIGILLDALFPDACRRKKSTKRRQNWLPLYGSTNCPAKDLNGLYEPMNGGSNPYQREGAPWDPSLLSSAETLLENFPDGSFEQSSAVPGKEFKRKVDFAGNSQVTDKKGNTHEHKASNETKIVEGEWVQHVKENGVLEIDGDFMLKVNGDFKIEVAGVMEEFTSSGPEVDDNGNVQDNGRARESTMVKGSDYSYETKGSYHIGANKISLYGTEGIDLKSQKGRIYMDGSSILGKASAIGWTSAVETNSVGFRQNNIIGTSIQGATGLGGITNVIVGNRITKFLGLVPSVDITTHLSTASSYIYNQPINSVYSVNQGASSAVSFLGGPGTAFTVNTAGAITMSTAGVCSIATAGKMFITGVGLITITASGPLTCIGVPILLN